MLSHRLGTDFESVRLAQNWENIGLLLVLRDKLFWKIGRENSVVFFLCKCLQIAAVEGKALSPPEKLKRLRI